MDREIKFRAWLPNEEKMTRCHNLKEIVAVCSLGYPDSAIWMRYTGLKDVNGVDIYEGDILQWTSSWKKHDNIQGKGMNYNNVVEYYVGSNYCGYRIRNKSFTKNLTGRNGILNASAIIIGNIHENPELL